MTIDPKVIEQLATFDTPSIANAIELFGVRDRTEGYLRGSVTACFPELPPVVGYAATISLRCAFAKPVGFQGTSVEAQVESFGDLPGPPVVLMEDADVPPVAAAFGEVMCSIYQRFGARAVITNGWGRDLPQIRSRRFPVFTSGSCCSHGHIHLLAIRQPVNMFGLIVRHGDILHADPNGVLVIPPEIASELPEATKRIQDAEQIVFDFVASGSHDQVKLREVRQDMHRQFELLESELRAGATTRH